MIFDVEEVVRLTHLNDCGQSHRFRERLILKLQELEQKIDNNYRIQNRALEIEISELKRKLNG